MKAYAIAAALVVCSVVWAYSWDATIPCKPLLPDSAATSSAPLIDKSHIDITATGATGGATGTVPVIPNGYATAQISTAGAAPLSPDDVFIGEKTYPISNWLQVPSKEMCTQLLELNKPRNHDLECIIKIGDSK